MDILKVLNDKQREAVETINGPVLVLAGAGSGKTKALTHRIAYLIMEKKIAPWNILAVTFTNKAAEEMNHRVKSLLIGNESAGRSNMPTIGTFHSLCIRILKQEIEKIGYKKNFVIYDSMDQESLVKQVMAELDIDKEQFKPKRVLANISGAKNDLKDAEKYAQEAQGYFEEVIKKIYRKYEEKLKENNALDFDDLIMRTTQLFRDHADVLDKYQEKYKYIMVDEYQDTNHSQYTLVRMLAQKHGNLFVIGDDWQSIYSWRNADIRNILEFERDYPKAKVISLEQNYRSTQNILDAADGVIAKNIQKKEKKLWTDNSKGHPVKVVEVRSERKEGEYIVSEINRLKRERGYRNSSFTVLYRTNAQSRAIEESFLNANIPYKVIGGMKFYDRKEVKDMMAYLKVLANPSDTISLERIVNTPPRGIGKIGAEEVMKIWGERESIGNLAKISPNVRKFLLMFNELQGAVYSKHLTVLMDMIIKQTKYKAYLCDGTEQGDYRWENVLELLSAASKYDILPPGEGLHNFLDDVSLVSDVDDLDSHSSTVNLMTMHCAKGLEFPVVFIVGLEEGIFPHSRSQFDPSQMEEERRLCYVGITRAKEMIYLLFARSRKIFGNIQANAPSRFLGDIPEHIVEVVEDTDFNADYDNVVYY